MMTCFRSCPQKFHLEFCRGLRPAGLSVDLHAGACFASAIEQVTRSVHVDGRPLKDALAIAHARFFVEWGDFEIPEFKRTAKTPDRVWEAVEAYFKLWSPLTDHVQPYRTASGEPTLEYTFAIPLDGETPHGIFPQHPSSAPFIYCGRFDLLGNYNGNPCVRDEKTTGSSIGSSWSKSWDLRSQFLGYVWACQQSGIDVNTVVVRGIGIQKTQIVLEETIKVYSQSLIEKWLEQLRRDLWRLRRCYDEGYFDYNLGDACTAYGHCNFMTACASPTPEPWLTEFEVRHWSPLKKNPTEEEFAL
jgi:hypothetical protein